MADHKITAAGDLVRATVWTEHGSSSQTFHTANEARAWIPGAIARRPTSPNQPANLPTDEEDNTDANVIKFPR